MAARFIADPFEITIHDGCASLAYPCGKTTVVPLRVLRIMRERVNTALDMHDRHCAQVVPLTRTG